MNNCNEIIKYGFKMLAVFGAIISFLWGIKSRSESSKKDFKKPLYIKQLDYYAEAVDATSTLATEDFNSEDYKKAKKNFYRLYWGRLAIVENNCVEADMINFRELLEKYEQNINCSVTDTLQFNNPCKVGLTINLTANKVGLQQASLNIAHSAFLHTSENFLERKERKEYNR